MVMAENFDCLTSSANSKKRYLSALRQFKCPFDDHSHRALVYSPPKLPNPKPRSCPFGHRWNQSSAPPKYRIIPAYICLRHLVGKCLNEVNKEQPDVERCGSGYHPTAEQMANLNEFDGKVALALWSRNIRSDDNIDHQCAICLGQILPGTNRKFGLLKNCSHVFCAECLAEWLERDDMKRCPVCRTHSLGMLIWPRMILSIQEKNDLFDLQYRTRVLMDAKPIIDPDDFPNMFFERLQGLAGVNMQVIRLPNANALAAAFDPTDDDPESELRQIPEIPEERQIVATANGRQNEEGIATQSPALLDAGADYVALRLFMRLLNDTDEQDTEDIE